MQSAPTLLSNLLKTTQCNTRSYCCGTRRALGGDDAFCDNKRLRGGGCWTIPGVDIQPKVLILFLVPIIERNNSNRRGKVEGEGRGRQQRRRGEWRRVACDTDADANIRPLSATTMIPRKGSRNTTMCLLSAAREIPRESRDQFFAQSQIISQVESLDTAGSDYFYTGIPL